MSKYDPIKQANTNGANYDVSTEDVIKKLQSWDSQYGIDISDIAHDSVTVKFHNLPADVEGLAKDIYEFCPDVIDQHFGCMDEMLEMIEETGQELIPELAELIEGVNLESENFGEILLQKSLQMTKTVALWWD